MSAQTIHDSETIAEASDQPGNRLVAAAEESPGDAGPKNALTNTIVMLSAKEHNMLFLIDYGRRKGQIVKMQRYHDSERNRANEERFSLEIDHIRSGVERDVVILEAASEASVRRTHRR
jgi:hypothetical protein